MENTLNMSRTELFQSIKQQRRDKTIFDVMDEILEFRKIGVDILVAFERKYNIPPALYSIEQVRQIGELRRTFDHSVIRCMNEQEFTYWVSDRFMEMHSMFDGYTDKTRSYGNYGQYKLYWMFAKKHPELIPEQQLKYLSEMELINVCNRAINDINEGDIRFRANYGKYYPLSDRKHDVKLLKDSFIDIILRCLIA